MERETRTFLITFIFCAVIAGMLVARIVMVKEPEPVPPLNSLPPPTPEPSREIDAPVAPVSWQQVNQNDTDANYWAKDRAKREAAISQDLAARKAATDKVRPEQTAREAAQKKLTETIIRTSARVFDISLGEPGPAFGSV